MAAACDVAEWCGGSRHAYRCALANASASAEGVTCSCTFAYTGPTCAVPVASDVLGTGWIAFCTLFVAEFGMLWVTQAAYLVKRGMARWRGARASRRDWVCVLNHAAITVRLIWFIDPLGAWLYDTTSGEFRLLQTMPQLLFVTCFVVLWLLWGKVTREVWGAKTGGTRARNAAIAAVAALYLLTLPPQIIHAIDPDMSQLHVISNGTMGVFVLGLTVSGVLYSRRLLTLLGGFRHARAAARVQRLIQHVTRTVATSTLLATIAIIAIIWGILMPWSPPARYPGRWLAYTFVIHTVVEGPIAWLLLSASWISQGSGAGSVDGSSSQGKARSSSAGTPKSRGKASSARATTNPMVQVENKGVDSG